MKHAYQNYYGKTCIGLVPGPIKFFTALGFVLVVALGPRTLHPVYLMIGTAVFIIGLAGRIPLRFVLGRLLIAEPVIVAAAVVVLFRPDRLQPVLITVLKANLCIITMLVFAWLTPFHELARTLQMLGCPRSILSILGLMDRYVPLLAEEALRMQRARASRTFANTGGSVWHVLASAMAALMIRALHRARRIHIAMQARGWN